MGHSIVVSSRGYIRGPLLSTKEFRVDVEIVKYHAHAPIKDVLNGLGTTVETGMGGQGQTPLCFILRLLEKKLRYYPLL